MLVWFFGPKRYGNGIESDPYFERDVEMTLDQGSLNYPIIKLNIDGVDRTFYYRGQTTCLHYQEAEVIVVRPNTSHLRGKVEVRETFYRPINLLSNEWECVNHKHILSPGNAWWDQVTDPCEVFRLGLAQFDPFHERTPTKLENVQRLLLRLRGT